MVPGNLPFFVHVLLISVLFSAFNDTLAGESHVVIGTIYNAQGKKVRGADICLYRTNFLRNDSTADRQFPRGATSCRKTGRSGTYELLLTDRDPYVLLARKKGFWVKRMLSPSPDIDTLRISDTLKNTGSLNFNVRAEEADRHNSTVALYGTPFLFRSDSSGNMSIRGIPAGSYAALLRSRYQGYRTVRCSLRIRTSQADLFTDTLFIPKQSAVYAPDNIITIQSSSAAPKKDTPLPSSARTLPPPKKQAAPQKPSAGNRKRQIPAQPPVVTAPADTFIGIFDSLTLTGTAHDNGSVTSIEWDIGNTGRFVQSAQGTVRLPPFKTPIDRLVCILRVTDNDGESSTDTTLVRIGLLWMSVSPPKELLGRNGHSLVEFNDMLWIIGGKRSDVWSSANGISWTLMTENAPFGNLFGHSTIVFNNHLWIIGGKTGPGTFSNVIWKSPAGVRWKKVTTMPFQKRVYHSTVVHQGKLWVIGGLSESENEPILNDVWSSADGINWKQALKHAPFASRYGHGSAVFNNGIVVLGGFNDAVGKQQTYNDVWRTTNGIDWKCLSEAAPFSKEHFHTVITFDNRLWAIGGYNKQDGTDRFTDIFFTVDGSSWTDLTPWQKGGGRFFCTAVPLGNRILVSPSESHKLWIMR
jgi:hypothetical protein